MINNLNSPLNLRLIKNCPICSSEYRQPNIQVLDESEYSVLTYASCHSCGANLLTKFAGLPQGVIGNAILTDLSPQEVMDFALLDDMDADDVLDIQHLLSKKELINNLKKLI
ncbi:Lar family restriction alleviation protein [Patescibacteria group bacterium]|nr:Lar family restriction alleviation protein [Patescibacteria group bacterium]